MPLDEAVAPVLGADMGVLDLERGLTELAGLSTRAATVVESRFFAGLTVEDTALALGVTARTVKRDWAFARAWLFDYLCGETTEES